MKKNVTARQALERLLPRVTGGGRVPSEYYVQLGRAIDSLRVDYRMDYNDIVELVQDTLPDLELADWEDVLAEVEHHRPG